MKDIQTNILGSAPRDLHVNEAAASAARMLVYRCWLCSVEPVRQMCTLSRNLPMVEAVHAGTFSWGEVA